MIQAYLTKHTLRGPEACVFFATTTVGSYEKTWTAEYMPANADWRDSYMATWQQIWSLRGEGK